MQKTKQVETTNIDETNLVLLSPSSISGTGQGVVVISLTGKVIVGLLESNSNIPPGL